MIMNSSGYSSLKVTPDDNSTGSRIFISAKRRILIRNLRKKRNRVGLGHAVASTSSSDVSICQPEAIPCFSVNSMDMKSSENIVNSEAVGRSRQRTLSEFLESSAKGWNSS